MAASAQVHPEYSSAATITCVRIISLAEPGIPVVGEVCSRSQVIGEPIANGSREQNVLGVEAEIDWSW